MSKITSQSEEKRIQILTELEKNKRKFVELKKLLGLESNLLAYNLNLLQKEGLLEKKGIYFQLSKKGKFAAAYAPEYTDASKIPLPCIVVIVKKGKKVLMKIKTTEPDKGKLSFISCKLKAGEDIHSLAKTAVKENLGINVRNLKIICINNYKIRAGKELKANYLVFFLKANPVEEPKKGKWINYETTEDILVPDNKFILKHMLNKDTIKVINSTYDETSDKFEVVNVY